MLPIPESFWVGPRPNMGSDRKARHTRICRYVRALLLLLAAPCAHLLQELSTGLLVVHGRSSACHVCRLKLGHVAPANIIINSSQASCDQQHATVMAWCARG